MSVLDNRTQRFVVAHSAQPETPWKEMERIDYQVVFGCFSVCFSVQGGLGGGLGSSQQPHTI